MICNQVGSFWPLSWSNLESQREWKDSVFVTPESMWQLKGICNNSCTNYCTWLSCHDQIESRYQKKRYFEWDPLLSFHVVFSRPLQLRGIAGGVDLTPARPRTLPEAFARYDRSWRSSQDLKSNTEDRMKVASERTHLGILIQSLFLPHLESISGLGQELIFLLVRHLRCVVVGL